MKTLSIKKQDITEIRFVEIIGGAKGLDVYKKYFKPGFKLTIINGGMYDNLTKRNIVRLKIGLNTSGYLFSETMMAISGPKTVKWMNWTDAYADFGVCNAIAFSPLILRDGQVNISWGKRDVDYSDYVDKIHFRSIIGDDDQDVKLSVTEEEVSIPKLAELAIKAGYKNAGNLDGGGSCYLQNGQTIIKFSSRSNVSWILIYQKGEGELKTNYELVEHAEMALKNKWGYVWGTWGLILTPLLLDQKVKQYPSSVGDYLAFIKRTWLGKRTVDCIGLIKSYLWWEGDDPKYRTTNDPLFPDVSADGLYEASQVHGNILTIDESIPGLAVWRKGHIGVYIGDGHVIEAKGTSFGVIMSPLKGPGANNWTTWFKIPYISYVEKPKPLFTDVAENRWSYDEIKTVKELGIMGGYPDGSFKPTEIVTREQIAVIAARQHELMLQQINGLLDDIKIETLKLLKEDK